MKILHLSTCAGNGGAARAAYRVHAALNREGHDSTMLVRCNGANLSKVQTFKPPDDPWRRWRRFLRQKQIRLAFRRYRATRPAGSEYFSDDRSACGPDLLAQMPRAEVINLHWVAGLVDYQSFLVPASGRAPLVWRLDDMNPFTGGCHYDNGCGKYLHGCGSCPQLGSHDDKDLSHHIWKRKRETFKSIPPHRLHIVALNRWMADKVASSPLLGDFPVTIIPNGLDLDDFSPRDPHFAREVLGLPRDAKVILFVAASVDNRRKGFTYLEQALAGLKHLPDLYLASVGHGKAAIAAPISYLHLGRTDNDRLLSLIYSAADLFVIPSLEDNLPNTVLESLGCGTPVVGFKVGGIPEMVQSGVTGLLAPVGEVDSLRAAILELLENPAKRREMAANCRRIALKEYSRELMARNFSQLYQRIVAEGP